jgi:Domain of unknown function (DUF5667)
VIANPAVHRRANAFADALEDGSPQEATGEQHGQPGQHGNRTRAHASDRQADPTQGRILSLANALRDVPRPKLEENRKVEQRALLIAAMETALGDGTLRVPEQGGTGRAADSDTGSGSGAVAVSPSGAGQNRGPLPGWLRGPGTGPDVGSGAHRAPRRGLHRFKPRSRWSRRLAAGGLSVGVAAGTFGGVAAASTNALPGDTLYGLKRGMEGMRVTLAGDESNRGQVYLDLASVRLQEARRLMERGRNTDLDDDSVAEVRRALSGMRQEASEGHQLLSTAYQRNGSLQLMEALSAFATAHRKGWSELRDRLPSQLSDVSDQVNSVFDAIEHDVAPLQSMLPATGRSGGSQGGSDQPGVGSHPGGTHGATPSSAPPTGNESANGTGTSSPSSSKSADSGLIGQAGGLLGSGSTPSPGASTPPETGGPQPSVTLPPLLPGLLPGLGLSAEDTE